MKIVPGAEEHAEGFNRAVDIVARERRYLALTSAPPLERSLQFLRFLCSGGGAIMVAVDDDNQVVGWCDVVRLSHEGFGHGGRFGMGVLPAFRGQGLGERMARATIDAAWAAGLSRIELDVFSSNVPAIRLYEKLGFVHEGRKIGARILDGERCDVVLMSLSREPAAE